MNPKTMYSLTYGLYLLSVRAQGRDNACIINTPVQVTSQPNRIVLAVNRDNLSCEMLRESGQCNLTVLTQSAPYALFQQFGMRSGRTVDKFAGQAGLLRSENGLYYLNRHAAAYLSARVISQQEVGTHILFLAEVTAGEVLSAETPLSYAYYQSNIKPRAAAAAQTGYRCTVCGYVHAGDTLPADLICPLCKHDATFFEKIGQTPVSIPTNNENKGDTTMKKFVCAVCGYVHEGDSAPEKCPVCKASAEKFNEQAAERTWAAEHVVGVAQGAPEDIMNDLRANFTGECTEVGMYLAMARVAHREGYPEIGLYWEKAAYEEAEHAAKFAELLGEVVTDSTKKNLQLRVDAENGATAGKFDLAKRAKALNLDAIHDTVHEMARDEARHGKGFEGLLGRYFK